jgi:phosphonate transport system ATP-binding protein
MSAPDAGAAPACELDAVTVAYGSVTAVPEVSLRADPGETVALVGSSGAGKTTLLRVLAGLLTPSAGSASLLGRPVAEQRHELPRLVGMMQQRLDLVGHLSVKHNVQAGALGRWGLVRSLAALLLPLEHPPARTAAERTGIADKLGMRVNRLSGGEEQRVALARLLVQDPAVMLADEPVASLDPARAHDVVDLLCALAREEGRTLVASLHTPELARAHFDRVVGLRAGRVAFDLPSHEVSDDRLHALYRVLGPAEPGEAGADQGEPRRPDGHAEGAAPERDAS